MILPAPATTPCSRCARRFGPRSVAAARLSEQPRECRGCPFDQTRPATPFLELVEMNLSRVLQVVEERRVHLRTDRSVEKYDVRFVVERHGPVVEVHRANRSPDAVGDNGFRMNHRRLVLIDLESRPEQLLVPMSTCVPRRLHVALFADGENANVDTALDGGFEQPAEIVVRYEIRIGDVQSMARAGDRQGDESLRRRAAGRRLREEQTGMNEP